MPARRALAPAFAVLSGPITPTKISRDIGLPEVLVREWVTHAETYEDRSGYRIFFKPETPREVTVRYPRLTPWNMLIVLAG